MFILINDLKVHYKVKGSGKPLVVLHGWGRSLEDFVRLQDELAGKFTVYAVDLPGFGLSPPPGMVWGSKDYAQFVHSFLQALQLQNPFLLGHSFGGKVLLYLVGECLLEPRKMVLIGSSGIRLPKSLKTYMRIYGVKLLKFLSKLPFINMFYGTRVALYQQKFGSYDYRMAQGIMRKILIKVLCEDVRSFLSRITIPTLLLWGEQDTETSLKAGKIMHQALVASQLKVVKGGGHLLFLENWQQVKGELIKFLE